MELGIYEQIINRFFKRKLDEMDQCKYYIGKKPIDKSNIAEYLSQYLYALIKQLFNQLGDDDRDLQRGIDIANSIIKQLAFDFSIKDDNLIDAQNQILTAVIDKSKNDYPDIEQHLAEVRPTSSMLHSSLFTGKGLSLLSELKKEIQTADEICFVVSFIKLSGINPLMDVLREFTGKGHSLKIVTTTYMQATDFKAVKKLAALSNTTIKISFNGNADRLHAKSYLFLRNSGLHTAYIGSSNLSNVAMTTGKEWNVKVTQMELPQMITAIKNSFDSYWNDDEFEVFRNGIDDNRLLAALMKETSLTSDYSLTDLLHARDYQNDILEKLQVDRQVHHHYRNLVVAATGTGKTVIAALDFKRFLEQHKGHARLLFVAHREEILKQSLNTFRMVLGDYNFGELWYGQNAVPQSYAHVFASKDIINNRIDGLQLADDYYDYIVIDEVHHVAANSYRKIIDKFKPKILLGLTATPERMDGKDITQDFDGHISAEIRLDTALNNELLSPFHYYGITDCVDLRKVSWKQGHYDVSELTRLYTGNDLRATLIINKLKEYLPDEHQVKALCFCVSQEHAKFMAAKFTLSGLRSASLTSENAYARTPLYNDLKTGRINYLFVVDMFNEGVDIPEIDTVLFLRPTESLTIFLQQFGRGLRKAKGKEFVTVLDFVGECRAEFNYTERFRAIIGRSSMSVAEEINHDFPHLPLNCQIALEPKAKEYVLANINQAIRKFSKNRIIGLVRDFKNNHGLNPTLTNFVKIYKTPLERIYNNGFSWNSYLYEAGLTAVHSKFESQLSKAVHNKWLSTDSYSYFSFISKIAAERFRVSVAGLDKTEQRMTLMLYYDLFQKAGQYVSLQDFMDDVSGDEITCHEIEEIMHILKNRCTTFEVDDNSGIADFPLKLHGIYTRDQIRVALGTSTLQRQSSVREGVERNKKLNVEAMYVDIIKNREEGSSTNYDDHALTDEVFQWDTQNKVSPDSPTGQNYIHQRQNTLLFVRQQSEFPDDKYRTMGYVYLGKTSYISHTYNRVSYGRQMQIKWKMATPIPASVMQYAKLSNVI